MTDIDDLAERLYPLIIPHTRRRNGSISYSDLCAALSGRWAGLEAGLIAKAGQKELGKDQDLRPLFQG